MKQSLNRNGVMRFGMTAALIALTFSATVFSRDSGAASTPRYPRSEFVYVGTMDSQIRALRFDPSNGELTLIGPVEGGLRSTWLLAHPRKPLLYSVDDHNNAEGSITAFAVDRRSGALKKVNDVATQGMGTTYMWLDRPSMTLLAANYNSGSVSTVALDRDGSVGALLSNVKETGSGPSRRQASAHAHSVAIDPSGRYALVPDLGADRVFIYDFDRENHVLSPQEKGGPAPFVTPPGTGPRHLVFGPDGRFVYLISELSAEIMVLGWDASAGRLSLVQTLALSSEGFAGVKSGAEIAVSSNGHFVYALNRAENTVQVYKVGARTGMLSEIQRTPSGGTRPWGFAIDSSGKWMLVENQQSGQVNVFEIDAASGKVSNTGESVNIPAPVSIAFVH